MLSEDIRTDRTRLRKYTEADRKDSVRLSLDTEVMHFMGGEHASNEDEANEFFDKCFDIYKGSLNGKPLGNRHFELWAIEFEGKMIGHFELKQTDITAENELEVVYFLDKYYWGRGFIPEILKAVNRYANSIGKVCIATINPDNIRTVKSLHKAGIEKEEWIGEGDDRVYKVVLKSDLPVRSVR